MTKLLACAILFPLAITDFTQKTQQARWSAEAKAVMITRDDWGIAHIHGKTDADAVFGMIYAQCEDDFNRVETNYLVSLGRLAEAEGEERIWQDLRQRLFIDPEELKTQYSSSPEWLKLLMNAWADGLNFYLAKHPAVHPRVITHWEPWMALSFTEGSIGGDIEKINLTSLRDFYSQDRSSVQGLFNPLAQSRETPVFSLLEQSGSNDSGSNGIAIAPSDSATHHALLLINPHTSFFFRSELQMSSDQGLNAYGAVTWGQIFVYQGFNDRAGWMHTSSNVDAVDEYAETVIPSHGGAAGYTYKYGEENRPLRTKQITLRYKDGNAMKQRTFTAFYTSHGPAVRADRGVWITVKLMNTPVPALEQSFLRTKARNYAEYKKTMELKANSSNNTVFADTDGDIAYWHGDFIPKRDSRFDFTQPVDGSNPATEWGDLMSLDEIPHLLNPASGYLFNVNNAPWHGAGESSLHRSEFPRYVEQGTETSRGIHAAAILAQQHAFTFDSLTTAAYDSYLPWFVRTLPPLIKAWDDLPVTDDRKSQLALRINLLRTWDKRWSVDSIPTTLAVTWAESVGLPLVGEAKHAGVLWEDYVVQHVDGPIMLKAFEASSDKLQHDLGTWKIPWGKYNRFQRTNDDIAPNFSDSGPSIPVPFTASQWGSLASFQSRTYPGTKLRYGTSGNSFVAVVEFGPRVHAKAVTAGGESGKPASKHFNDEAERYATGNLRDVYFYPNELMGHIERNYYPGEQKFRLLHGTKGSSRSWSLENPLLLFSGQALAYNTGDTEQASAQQSKAGRLRSRSHFHI